MPQSHIHPLLFILDFKILSELESNIGWIDSVIETENYLFIIEFKINDSSIGLQQILDKKYYEQFLLFGKKIILAGVGVGTIEHNVND